jgi:hypothetical protein
VVCACADVLAAAIVDDATAIAKNIVRRDKLYPTDFRTVSVHRLKVGATSGPPQRPPWVDVVEKGPLKP